MSRVEYLEDTVYVYERVLRYVVGQHRPRGTVAVLILWATSAEFGTVSVGHPSVCPKYDVYSLYILTKETKRKMNHPG